MKSVLNKIVLMTALICGSVLWGGTAAFAEENIGEFSLDTMVVTATRTSEELLKVPASIHVITAKDIEEKNILTISDAIKTLPGVYDGRRHVGRCQWYSNAWLWRSRCFSII